MSQERVYASFLLDRALGQEISIQAEKVIEATRVSCEIQSLSVSAPFLEGIMRLRDEVIPVINLKKRLGLENTSYDSDATVAVITLGQQQYGLLFDGIKDVLRVDNASVVPFESALQSEDHIITDLIKLNKGQRTMELLNLKYLFHGEKPFSTDTEEPPSQSSQPAKTYSRFVIFIAGDQKYGVPVNQAREITFPAKIDETFKSGAVEGGLQLREQTIPVMPARALLNVGSESCAGGEACRILVLTTDEVPFGIIVDEVREILTIPDQEILTVPVREDQSLSGIYEAKDGGDIMLLDVDQLIGAHKDQLKAVVHINAEKSAEKSDEGATEAARSRHLITENCYLVFSADKHFAIELKDVQEIIEPDAVMAIPAASGYNSEVINLRGQILPVINLRRFYGYPEQETEDENSRLIICNDGSQLIALKVDSIVTIYKQEKYHATPHLNPQLEDKKDTLDRLIEFIHEDGVMEHVLVVNIYNLSRNYLQHTETLYDPDVETGNSETQEDKTIETSKGGTK